MSHHAAHSLSPAARSYESGARVFLNGWTMGFSAATTSYTALDAEVDLFSTLYPDALVISGAGNNGESEPGARDCGPDSVAAAGPGSGGAAAAVPRRFAALWYRQSC